MSRIAELIGHASVRTTEIYARFRPAEKGDVERALSAVNGKSPEQHKDELAATRERRIAEAAIEM